MINMNKGVKRIVLSAIFFLCVLGLFLGCLSALFVMTGCAREDADPAVLFADRLVASEEYEVVLEETFVGSADEGKDFVALCRSLSEMKAVCSRNGYGGLFHEENPGSGIYDHEAAEVLCGLTSQDFQDTAYVVCGFYKSTDPGQFRIEGMDVAGSKLILYVEYPDSILEQDSVVTYLLIAKVDQALVPDVTEAMCVIG